VKLTPFLHLILLALLTTTLPAQTRPVPPGIRQADQTEDQTQKNIPPPQNTRSKVDPEKLKRDADELAALAKSIPLAVDQTTKGTLPKDLNDNLKRIEKLAKQLRNEVNP
jgi:hypothetical protein